MVIEIKDKWAVLVKDDTLQQNAKKAYEVKFVFDESWNGFSKTTIFEAGPVSIIVALTEDRCMIPSECLKHGSVKLKIGVHGLNGEIRKPTVWCETSLIVPATGPGAGYSPGISSPDGIYSDIMAAIGDLSAAGFEGKTLAEIFLEIKNNTCCDTATDQETEHMINEVFGREAPCAPPTADNTATDEEVDKLLGDIFG